MINERSNACKSFGCMIMDCKENGRCMDLNKAAPSGSAKTVGIERAGARAFTDHNDVARDPIGAWSEIATLRGALDTLRELHYDADAPITGRAEILDAAKQCVTVDRAANHGDMENNFGLIAAYWSSHLDTAVSATDVATMMTLLKLARARGNPTHMDNWVDAAGYVACGGEAAAKK